jgi:hypothetical protein
MLRPIALAFIFLTRWQGITRARRAYDPSALIAFSSHPTSSVTAKLQAIHEMFLALSDELKTTKEKLLAAKQAARAMSE